MWCFFRTLYTYFAKDIGLDCFSSLGNPDKTLGAGFLELRRFYDRWLEIMGDHDVSLEFVVFPDVPALYGLYLQSCS